MPDKVKSMSQILKLKKQISFVLKSIHM